MRFLYFLFIIYFLFVFSDAHRLRSSMNYVKSLKNYQLVYNQENLRLAGNYQNSMEIAITVLYYILQMKKDKIAKTWLTEDPYKLYEIYKFSNFIGSCYNDAVLFNFLAKSSGLLTRIVEFASPDGLGGSGHTVNEFYSSEYNKWVLIDANLGIMFFGLNNLPLSAYEVRRIALNSKDVDDFLNNVLVVSFDGKFSKRILWKYYRFNAVEMLIINDDLMPRSYGRKIAYFFENLNCDGCVKFGRFLRSLFSPLNRIRIEDEFSPKINYSIYFYTFQIAFGIFISLNIFYISKFLRRL